MSNAGRQKVMAKHKSHSQKELHAKRKKESYAQMEPAMKKKVLSDKAMWYKSLDPAEKGKLLSHRAEWYKSLDPKEKEKLLSKSADWYKSLGSAEKQNLLSSRAIWYKSLDTAQKQKRAEWFNYLNSAQKQKRAEWYKSLNPEEKEKLLSGKVEWYKTLDPADKDKILSKVQANKEAYRNSVQHDLDHKITTFPTKIREGSYYFCSVCNRTLYRKTVIQLKKQMDNTLQELFTEINSFDENQYICKTCHTKVLKGQVPCQAVCNKLHVDELPPELSILEKLEQIHHRE